jgi:hypothetical protein
MTQNTSSNGTPEPDDDDAEGIPRIDANPPYGPRSADAAERFRKLLADLIARRILAERRKPPANGGGTGC